MNGRALLAVLLFVSAVPADAGSRSQAGRLIVEALQELRARDYDKAIGLLEKATRADPNSANAFAHLGNAYYRKAFQRGTPEAADKDDARNALEAFDAAVALDPGLRTVREPYFVHHAMAQCHEALNQYEDALAAVKRATVLSQDNPMPYLYGAKLRYKMQDYANSAANLYHGVQRARRMNAYPALAKMVKSDPLFMSLLDIPQNKTILEAYDAVESGTLTEGEAKERIRNSSGYKDALTALPRSDSRPKALGEPMRDPAVLKRLDIANAAFKHQHYPAAIDNYRAALEEDSRRGTLDSAQKSAIHENIGSSYRNMGLAGEAVRSLRSAVEEMPQNASAHYQLSLSYAIAGELDNALTCLNKALDNARTLPELRQIMIMSKTDSEMTALQGLPRFKEILNSHKGKLTARR
ncbi:MAG: tetratricopeptide repeat protein [Elusimicrobiota bacterium]